MKKFLGLPLLLLLVGCSLLEQPEGIAELSETSVSTRIERPTTTEEIVYCTADVKITNTSDKTIYNCTVTAVAKSDKGIEHYVSLNYDVNIPPSQSIYVTLEWTLKRPIKTTTKTNSHSDTSGTSSGGSGYSTNESTTTSTSTSKPEVTLIEYGETDWNKNSITILDYYFN